MNLWNVLSCIRVLGNSCFRGNLYALRNPNSADGRPRGSELVSGRGPRPPIAPALLSQKESLFLTRPFLFHYIERRDALEASANELFEAVASGKLCINVSQRFALKDAADAHKALEARATSGSTIPTI